MAVTFDFRAKFYEEKKAEEERLFDFLTENYDYKAVRAKLLYKNTYNDRTWEETRRIRKTYGKNKDVFILAKGKRNWGNHIDYSTIQTITVPEKRKTKEQVWEDSWKKVLSYLEQSGLWVRIADEIRAILDIGLEKLKEVDKLNDSKWNLEYNDIEGKQAINKQIQDIDKRLTYTNDDGEIVVTELWKFKNPAKIKTIYFGKHDTERVREELKHAIETGEDYEKGKQVVDYYDTRVSYNAELKKGWYSEEYRNCGNGHYYLLLDHEHAIHYEDD